MNTLRCVSRRRWPLGLICQTRCYTQQVSGLSDLQKPVQSYISKSRDPYLNLSIEHYLLQKSHADSAILFLYVNRPSIILGRNQNPWLEVNLGLLKAGQKHHEAAPQTELPALGDVDLVRRRSGGGTVFHDEGNVNWTVISPSAQFTRDKHAEMVVRGLRSCGIGRSRVNERHDIVLDQGAQQYDGTWGPEEDTHVTPWQVQDAAGPRPLKVSGSAYKLTRARALHHGTCLLSSPNLNIIPHYLRSPAKPFIRGRGVESVSSPVGNILLGNDEFIERVQSYFSELYPGADSAPTVVDESWLDIEEVRKGFDELKSPEWTYLQTPQFTFSDKLGEGESAGAQEGAQIELTVRNGAITESKFGTEGIRPQEADRLRELLVKQKLHEITDWSQVFAEAGIDSEGPRSLSKWVQEMLPSPGEDV